MTDSFFSGPFQTTLRNPVSCSGIGLHSGAVVNMTLLPAEAGSGIVFRRTDVPAEIGEVPARYDLVADTRLGTTIRNEDGVTVSTIEHLMSAIWGLGLDNAIIELDGPEVPIMDGSAEPFVFMVECAGLKQLTEPREVVRVLKAVEVRDGECFASIRPAESWHEGFTLDITIDFKHDLVGCEHAIYDFGQITFKQMLSRARTFGFEHEVAALRSAGLALGGSLDNAIVVGKERILNEGGLRYSDEFLRHKALDCVGDYFLAGKRIIGRVSCYRPGHGVNNQLLRALFADRKAWRIEAQEAQNLKLTPVAAMPTEAGLQPIA